MNYKIDKGIPLPNSGNHLVKFHGFPFADMEVGDSFFVARSDYKTLTTITSAIQSFCKSKKGKDVKLSYRKITEDGVLGYRVWRIR